MPRRNQAKREWPKTVKSGSFVAKLYKAKRVIKGSEYPYFRLAYYAPGQGRVVKDFADEQAAIEAAESVAKAMAAGRENALQFASRELHEFEMASKLLKQTGASVYQAAAEFAERFKTRPEAIERKTVQEVVAEYLQDLERRGVSEDYREHATKACRTFSKSFTGPLSSISTEIFREWLYGFRKRDGSKPSGRYLLNFSRSFIAITAFAARRKYMTKAAAEEFAAMERPKAAAPGCAVFTPHDLAKLLNAAEDDTRPAFVLGALCGLRTAEISRLDWSAVNLPERVVFVEAGVAKTASRRVVPICEAALEWLLPLAKESGRVLPVPERFMVRVAQKAGVPWVKNGLRHGFCSARLAVTADAAKVAFEAGNSPSIIQSNYRALFTRSQGEAWFDVRPAATSNVIPLPGQKEATA